MRKILLLLATLIWLGFWWWWYTCKICTTCICALKEAPAQVIIPRETGVLLFNLGDTTVLTQSGWPAYRDSMIAATGTDQVLEIEGHFLSEESNQTEYANLGLARAAAIRELFPEMIRKQIRSTSLRIERREGMDQYPFVASALYIRPIENTSVETFDKTLLYFDSNSGKRRLDPESDSLLSDLVNTYKDERAVFEITGHTDDRGSEKENLKLGLARARSIQNHLVGKGIDKSRIRISSKGESEPIAGNKTADGRKMNRRIEIEIIQKL